MSKQVERLKKDLVEVRDAINAFRSETVQLIIIDRVLDHLGSRNSLDEKGIESAVVSTDLPPNPIGKMKPDQPKNPAGKKMGATRILNQLIATDFFDTPKSIAAITEFCLIKYDTVLQTNQVSGVLLALIKENKLLRITSEETNRFVYLRPTETTP